MNKLRKHLRSRLDPIWNIGVTADTHPRKAKQTRLINQISFIAIGLTIPYLLIYLFYGLYFAAFLDALFIALYSFVILVVHLKKPDLARGALIVTGNSHVLAVSYLLGEGGGLHHFFYATAIAPMFFDFPFFGIATSAISYSIFLFLYSNYGPYYHLPETFLNLLFHGTFYFSLLGVFGFSYYFYAESRRADERLEEEKRRSESLLLNILPEPIAKRLMDGEKCIADKFEKVYVIFSDVVNFTEMSSKMTPAEVVEILNLIFTEFDSLVEKHGLEKIKTTGDAYLAVDVVSDLHSNRLSPVIDLGIEVLAAVQRVSDKIGKKITIRIGIHSGPVVAGVIGSKKFIYDIWGDTVNTASRMESMGEAGGIQVSDSLYRSHQGKYEFEERGWIEVKGKGRMLTYWVNGKATT